VLELVNTSTIRAEIGSGGSADVLESFTFRGPCIVIYSCNKPNEMHWFLMFIFGIELYMFRTEIIIIIIIYIKDWTL
jgi:hypothetical protein